MNFRKNIAYVCVGIFSAVILLMGVTLKTTLAYELQWSGDLGNGTTGFAIGDTDNDGENELVVVVGDETDYCGNQYGYYAYKAYLYVLKWEESTPGAGDWAYREQWKSPTALGCYWGHQTAVITDTDNDGLNEIAVTHFGSWPENRTAEVYEWNGTTYVLQGETAAASRSTDFIAVGDTDNDGTLNEVVVGTTDTGSTGTTRVLRWNGSVYQELWNAGQIMYSSSPMVGDTDNDGQNEIFTGDNFGRLFALKWDGLTYTKQWEKGLCGRHRGCHQRWG